MCVCLCCNVCVCEGVCTWCVCGCVCSEPVTKDCVSSPVNIFSHPPTHQHTNLHTFTPTYPPPKHTTHAHTHTQLHHQMCSCIHLFLSLSLSRSVYLFTGYVIAALHCRDCWGNCCFCRKLISERTFIEHLRKFWRKSNIKVLVFSNLL